MKVNGPTSNNLFKVMTYKTAHENMRATVKPKYDIVY